MDRVLLKAVLKTQLNAAFISGISAEQFSNTFVPGILEYLGTCPMKLLALMDVLQEVTDELVAEAIGTAVPNVKPQSSTARHPNYD